MAAPTRQGTPAFTWLGHSAIRIDTAEEKVVLIDPWLKNPKAPPGAMGLERVDAILLTHGHFDHLGETLELAQRFRAPVVAIHEVAEYLLKHGVKGAIGMNKGGTVEVAGLEATMTSADHSGGISTPEGIVSGGAGAGFVLKFPDGTRVWHSGDTNLFSDLRLIGDLHRPTLGFLCIGGHYTMGPREAALAAQWVGLETVVPIHWGTFPLLSGTPQALEAELRGKGVRVVSPRPGDRQDLARVPAAAR